MAKTTQVLITDDLDGSAKAETYAISWQGVDYTIDLSSKNFKALDKALRPYLDVATKTKSNRSRRTAPAKAAKRDLSDVRTWARSNGYSVSDRGRVSADVIAAYDAR